MNRQTRFFPVREGLFAIALAILLACGCAENLSERTANLPSQERLYAEALLAGVDELGEGWQEVGRRIIACSVYDRIDDTRQGSQDALPFIAENRERLLRPAGPCGLLFGAAYGAGATDPELSAVYLCDRYHALPLTADDALPAVPEVAWTLGEDGIAVGTFAPAAARVSAVLAAAATAGPVMRKDSGAKAGDGTGEEGSEQACAAQQSGPAPAADGEASGDAPPALAAEEPAPPPAAAARDGYLTCLAANGMLVKIWSRSPISEPRVQAAVTAIRQRLASSAAFEAKLRSETLSRHENRAPAINVETKWNPNADVYWRLLDFAIGGTILRKRY